MKRFVLFTNVISPHQFPLAKELVKLAGDYNFRYIYTQDYDKDHCDLDWRNEVPKWCIKANDVEAQEWLENADVLLSGLREFDLFERRAANGLKNLYMTERWFKPPIGMLRLLHPRYFGYAKRLCRMMTDGKVIGLPIGIHAARDMARLCGLMHGDLRCLFRAPKLEFDKRPGGKIGVRGQGLVVSGQLLVASRRYCLDKMRVWGYFVESGERGTGNGEQEENDKRFRVLWVGRLLKLKRVDTVIRAVGELSTQRNITFDIYGLGPEENRLKKLAAKYGEAVKFHPPVAIGEVRKLMREHDIYVLASNGYEGWGAVVSEALEEGVLVVGTYEAGSSVTMLPESCLFHSGDWRTLKEILQSEIPQCGIGTWSAKDAAAELVKLLV